MRKFNGLRAFLAATAVVAISGASLKAAVLSETDKDYLKQATEEVIGEASLSRIADKHAKDEKVQSYAHEMIKGSEVMEKELHEIADKYGYVLPNHDDWAKANDARLHEMQAKSDFDKAYLDEQISDHEEMIKLFDKASDRTDLEALKKWFGKKSPDLHSQLDRAHALREKFPA